MKNNTIIKTKKIYSPCEKRNLILTIVFSIFSLGFGFVISFFGKGISFIETNLIIAIITLFGFGLTATVFVYQALVKFNSKETMDVIIALSKTLLLTLCLIASSLVLDFCESIILFNRWNIFLKSLKYASLIYSFICQLDILNGFIIIIQSDKTDNCKKDE